MDKYQNLYAGLLKLKTPKEVEEFLTDVLTPQELEDMSDRFLVACELAKGKPQRQVSSETGVSIATVTRVNRWLRAGMGGYRLLISRLHHISVPAAGG